MDAIGPWSDDGANIPEGNSEQNQDLFGLVSTCFLVDPWICLYAMDQERWLL